MKEYKTEQEFHAFHDGRHYLRDRYEKSGLLVLNPYVDWDSITKDPCEYCEFRTPNRLMCCENARNCEKKQNQLLAIEIFEHFNKNDEATDNIIEIK